MAKKKATRRTRPSSGNAAPGKPGVKPKVRAAASTTGVERPDQKRLPVDAVPAGISVIVGIGGSAGGLAPLREFLAALPVDRGMAFVVVTHQASDGQSLLPEILAKATAMPVQEVHHGTRVEANHVYVVGRGHRVEISDGVLQLEQSLERGLTPLPIDVFFRSLARDQGQRAVGVILSGTGTDGTLGLAEIQVAGGLSLVQAPTSAEFDGMPTSAIAAHSADTVLPIADLAAFLTTYVRDRTSNPAVHAELEQAPELDRILETIRVRGGQDFSQYKRGTLLRRVERRMELHRISHLQDYERFLKANVEEIDALWRDWLIGVTRFFRDPDAFDALARTGLPALLAAHKTGSPFRIWVPGCATGEEAYSLAMVVIEALQHSGKRLDVQVFATDLDPVAIHTARQARYPAGIAADIGAERLERYFVREEGSFRAKRELRDAVVFAVQNVLLDPPFTHVDLISCRNLLIYIVANAQQELLPIFHYSLNPGGLLLLGASESVSGLEELFTPLDRRWKIFRRNDGAPSAPMPHWTGRPPFVLNAAKEGIATGAVRTDLADLQRRTLAERFGPPAAIVDGRGQIQQIHGRVGAYLELAPGRASLGVVEMARDGLRAPLSSALREVQKGGATEVKRTARIKLDGDWQPVQLTVARIDDRHCAFPLFLVTFEQQPSGRRRNVGKTERAAREHKSDHRSHLEQELQHTRQDLQSSINELQSANEELASANEEVQSANEELQSSNEELQTSKEETQSLNEELHTVNAELTQKLAALEQANDDLLNLMNNVEIATIFLDDELRVLRFTPQARIVANLIDTDVGRPLADMATNLHYPELLTDARSVMQTLKPVEKRVAASGGAWYAVRIRAYRKAQNAVQGLVINFIDITQSVRANRIEAAHELADSIVDSVQGPLLVLDGEMRVVRANRAFYDVFRVEPAATDGELVYALGAGQWDIPGLRDLLERTLRQGLGFEGVDVECEFPGLGRTRMRLSARPILNKEAAPFSLIVLGIEVLNPTAPKNDGTSGKPTP
ncbi:MAG: PAS domain-containing protein [Planctomycetes bacterium]|nr:PAS domain-containing protein [Planctomycetota bacterium]